jgi:adenosine deaminase
VVGQCRRVDATRQRADRLKGLLEVVAEATRGRFCGAAPRSLARQLGGEFEPDAQRDKPLLRAVVQVALDAPTFVVDGQLACRAAGDLLEQDGGGPFQLEPIEDGGHGDVAGGSRGRGQLGRHSLAHAQDDVPVAPRRARSPAQRPQPLRIEAEAGRGTLDRTGDVRHPRHRVIGAIGWDSVRRRSRSNVRGAGVSVEYQEYLRRVPKVELHCHFEGTVRASTFADLARKHGVELPTQEVDKLYDYDSIYEFLTIFGMVSSTLRDRDDFARAAYESLEDGVELGNLKYREMFFNPTLHTRRGIPYATVVDGMVDGIRRAEEELGIGCRLIADVYRQDPPQMAADMVRDVLEHRRDELIGLGMDGAEAPDPPEKFVEAYRLAKDGGLRLTAHACEDAPAQNITTCLDVLGCERIDHGYHVLGDPDVVKRTRDEGIVFTVCPTATAVCYFDADDLTTHPIRRMADEGLRIMLNSDDPPMFHTDIGTEYVGMVSAAEWGPDRVRRFVMNGIDGAWLSDDEKRRMREAFERELDELDAQLDTAGAP